MSNSKHAQPKMDPQFKTYVRRLARQSGIKMKRQPGGQRDYGPEIFAFADALVIEAMSQFEDALAAATVSEFTNKNTSEAVED